MSKREVFRALTYPMTIKSCLDTLSNTTQQGQSGSMISCSAEQILEVTGLSQDRPLP